MHDWTNADVGYAVALHAFDTVLEGGPACCYAAVLMHVCEENWNIAFFIATEISRGNLF